MDILLTPFIFNKNEEISSLFNFTLAQILKSNKEDSIKSSIWYKYAKNIFSQKDHKEPVSIKIRCFDFGYSVAL